MTDTPPLDRQFAQLARLLRDGIIEQYAARGEALDTPTGRRMLDTNSTLAAERGRLLLRLLGQRGGPSDLCGLRVADLGCGFGALSLYLALAGAEVVGVDPNPVRAEVSADIAARTGLPARFARGWTEDLTLEAGAFDVVVCNNSLCYLVDRRDRRAAARHMLRILRPGGWALIRNPARMAVLDPFTRRPLVHQLPPAMTARLVPGRSRVRLRTAGAVSRELRRAGFVSVHHERLDEPWWLPPRYQHHTARRRAA